MVFHRVLFPAVVAFALASAIPRSSHAAGVAPAQATAVQREQAQARFLRGKEKFAKGQHQEALTEFNASLEIVASPNTRLYAARSLREMGRLVEAYVELGRTEIEAKELARDDPRYAMAGQSAHDERARLEPKLGFVELSVTNAKPTTTVKVGNDELRQGGWNEPIPVNPGETKIVVETPGRAPLERSVTVAAAEKKPLAVDASEAVVVASDAPPPPPPPPSVSTARLAAYVAGGAAVAGLGMFVFFGLKTDNTYSELDSACSGTRCPPNQNHESLISQGKAEALAANVSLGVFAVGAVAAVTLWLLSPSSKAAPAAPAADAKAARLRLGPLGLAGTF